MHLIVFVHTMHKTTLPHYMTATDFNSTVSYRSFFLSGRDMSVALPCGSLNRGGNYNPYHLTDEIFLASLRKVCDLLQAFCVFPRHISSLSHIQLNDSRYDM